MGVGTGGHIFHWGRGPPAPSRTAPARDGRGEKLMPPSYLLDEILDAPLAVSVSYRAHCCRLTEGCFYVFCELQTGATAVALATRRPCFVSSGLRVITDQA